MQPVIKISNSAITYPRSHSSIVENKGLWTPIHCFSCYRIILLDENQQIHISYQSTVSRELISKHSFRTNLPTFLFNLLNFLLCSLFPKHLSHEWKEHRTEIHCSLIQHIFIYFVLKLARIVFYWLQQRILSADIRGGGGRKHRDYLPNWHLPPIKSQLPATNLGIRK